jgi:hypothetical protein
MFGPADGSRRRCTLSLRPVGQTLSVPSSVPALCGAVYPYLPVHRLVVSVQPPPLPQFPRDHGLLE